VKTEPYLPAGCFEGRFIYRYLDRFNAGPYSQPKKCVDTPGGSSPCKSWTGTAVLSIVYGLLLN